MVDNSGRGLARRALPVQEGGVCFRLIENRENVGFGAAVNQAVRQSSSPYVVTLNDDAAAEPEWIDTLVRAVEMRPEVGMCASSVLLYGRDLLDSAGMRIAGDGSSKQRGHLEPPSCYAEASEALLPSASAALYRRAMLDQIGLFDEDFFLYCEDTDLGLRARWAGWECAYAPEARVEHHYSHSSGAASALKAYYVERNRVFVLIKNFPARMLCAAPWITLGRYWWHLAAMIRNRGAAGRYRREEGAGALTLAATVLRAHCAAMGRLANLWRKRREIRRSARLSPAEFRKLARAHWISARKVAEL